MSRKRVESNDGKSWKMKDDTHLRVEASSLLKLGFRFNVH